MESVKNIIVEQKIKSNRHTWLFWSMIGCLMVFLFCSYSFAHILFPVKSDGINQQFPASLSKYAIEPQSANFQFPVETLPMSIDQIEPDEEDSESHISHNQKLFSEIHNTFSGIQGVECLSSIISLLSFSDSRPQLHLFVLYHSWKSYIL